MGSSRSLSGGSRRGPFRRHRNAVVMLGRMIALHHRMTQNAADMMQLIQETLNQADEAPCRRIHGGHDGARHHHVRGLSLAESSRPRAHDHARLDEVEPPGPGIRHSVNSEDLADPPPLVDFQSLQLHVDHQHNAVVNPKSLSYGVVTGDANEAIDPRPKSSMAHPHVGQPNIKKANVPSSIMDKGGMIGAEQSGSDAVLHPPRGRTPRSLQHVQYLALQRQLQYLLAWAHSPLLNPFQKRLLMLTPMPAIQELPRRYLAPGQRKMTSSFAA